MDLKHRGAQPTEWKREWEVAELGGVHLGSSVAKDQTRGCRRQVQDQLAVFSKQGESYGLVSVSLWKQCNRRTYCFL